MKRSRETYIFRSIQQLAPFRVLGDRQAKLKALWEWWSSRSSALLDRIETQSASGEELRPLFGRILSPSAEGATIGRGI